ncbi:MAG TPA: anti-sigma factor [Candidatus Dormibacteraeota bacterium]|nr:anti-sigma factor [Candidatus Dormibacteraeota bacterium]
MNCHDVDEIAAAFALGAVEVNERRAIEQHFETCREPHVELRAALGVGPMLAASTEPMPPDEALRDRVMATAAATPQEHRGFATARPVAPTIGRDRDARPRWLSGWGSSTLMRGLALGGIAATLVLAVVAGTLWGQLRDREELLRATAMAIANGEVAYRVQGEAGSGYLVDTEGSGATLIMAGVGELPAELLYELWLIDAEGVPIPAGTFRPTTDEIAVVPVAHDLAGFTTFAVTIEEEPVERPTTDPVMVAPLQG